MYFMEDDALRELEKLMRSVPNFPPRGHGVILLCRSAPDGILCDSEKCPYPTGRKEESGCRECLSNRIKAGTARYSEILKETNSFLVPFNRLSGFNRNRRKFKVRRQL